MTCQVQDRLGAAMVANQKEFSPRKTTEWYEMCGVLGLLLCGVKPGLEVEADFSPTTSLGKGLHTARQSSHSGHLPRTAARHPPFYSRYAKSLRRPCSTTNDTRIAFLPTTPPYLHALY